MNKLLPLLTALLLAVACPARSQAFRYADPEYAAPQRNPLAQQTAALTAYYTDVLRLNTRQQLAVRRCIARYLNQVDALDWCLSPDTPAGSSPEAITAELQAGLLRVLTPRQCGLLLLMLEQPLPEVLPEAQLWATEPAR
ncbi:hypothetical protein LJY25_13370 [Hymenobacter sp. BT175]|uniref:hypothetical protein n=1 Tax=Hymenobacter translucens TaxID=2886507 RepID=UPI001D0E6F9F|nr:hypothetical protein [Hymenobacter translucens]MCC2547439.1 hypothetical protein [Hymenobacter translucens]